MLTTAPTGSLEVWAAAQTLRVVAVAPPTATAPPASLGGLHQVQRLVEGLAERGHQVTLIGRGLGELTGGGYSVIDTDPTGGQHASAEIVERLHAQQAGKVLEQLGSVDVVSDHTRLGWLPAGQQSPDGRTVQTSYQALADPPGPTRRTGHLGWVAVSQHQQRNAPGMPWAKVIHPAIPVGRHPLGTSHGGPCAYLGPLLERHGGGLALAAAHTAGVPIVLAGTQSSAEATAYTEVELRPQLASGDELLERVSPVERWELLADACCLIAPLHPMVPYSLEIVEAMAYGAPVVTLAGTVGAELVNHSPAGLIADDLAGLPRAIDGIGRLHPNGVRNWASTQFDLSVMVRAYERLLSQLVAKGAR